MLSSQRTLHESACYWRDRTHGHLIVNGLIGRGYQVAMLHTGKHEVDEIPPEVEHIHTDPFSEDALKHALGSPHF